MYQKEKNCIRYKGRFKGLPLHSACGYGRLEVALKLLEWDNSTLERASVPVILPAFTKTTEPKAVDPVLAYIITIHINLSCHKFIYRRKKKASKAL